MTTEDRILDACESLIQERGYFGFSFADVAGEVGIRKASIYYYFPAKAELGKKVVNRYRNRMRVVCEDWFEAENLDVGEAFKAFMEPIVTLGRKPGAACLCGVLGGEFQSLPKIVRDEVSEFFEEHQRTLALLFENGRNDGVFRFDGDPKALAKVAFSMIEGSFLIKRTQNDLSVFDDAVANLDAMIGTSQPRPL
ncbi:TetR/AcrR family transcriptional regulator [uncultured Roseobacter sp.]|uniref:TetR/AcrR family transcriptional regulator n=1 Tax=uncultured Roseobacter sp. TaxID=114847 RepID=UPI002625FF76|nr:TetR/AcrR family transcriptional regulator [uncultured Roseobacter sp.]